MLLQDIHRQNVPNSPEVIRDKHKPDIGACSFNALHCQYVIEPLPKAFGIALWFRKGAPLSPAVVCKDALWF